MMLLCVALLLLLQSEGYRIIGLIISIGDIKKKTIPFHKEIRYNTKTDSDFGKKCSSFIPSRWESRLCV